MLLQSQDPQLLARLSSLEVELEVALAVASEARVREIASVYGHVAGGQDVCQGAASSKILPPSYWRLNSSWGDLCHL